MSKTILGIFCAVSDETSDPRANLSPLFTYELLKVATRRQYLSMLGIFWLYFWDFLKNHSISIFFINQNARYFKFLVNKNAIKCLEGILQTKLVGNIFKI